MKVLSGVYTPDEGTICLNGKKAQAPHPHLSAEGGISIIYQELSVVNWLDIPREISLWGAFHEKVGPLSVVNYAEMDKENQRAFGKGEPWPLKATTR